MKKLLCFAIALFMLVSFMPDAINVYAEGQTSYSYEVYSVNSVPKANSVSVFDVSYGEVFDASGKYKYIAYAFENGTCVEICENKSIKIPYAGYVAVIRGTTLLREVKDIGLEVGDTVIYDALAGEIIFMGKNYNPFYENTISFDRFNGTRSENTIIIYDKGTKTNTNIWGYEVVVDSDGYVSAVGGNDNEIPAGGMVISAVGKERIASLQNAASLGLAVTVNKEEKTIAFAFNMASISGELNVMYTNLQNSIEDKKSGYAVLDYDKLEEISGRLSEKLQSVKAAGDDISTAMKARVEFNAIYSDAEKLLYEYPAVEERAIWVRPEVSSDVSVVKETVKNIYDSGFNAICLELLFDSVTIFPIETEEYLFSQNPALNGFDLLEAYIEECHKYGIELFGWMSCFRVSHSTTAYKSLAVSTLKPEWLCKAKSGTTDVGDTGGKFLNPALPEVTEFLLKFYKYIIENYSLDGFQMDYIRYPLATGEDFGYDDYTLSLFEEKYGKNPVNISKSDDLWDDWCIFRASFVTEFVSKVNDLVNTLRPDMYVCADVAPDYREVYSKYMQEAEIWLKSQSIDIAFPMVYGTNVVPLYSSFTVDAAGENAYSFIGLADYGYDVLNREISEAREAGAEGFAFFAYAQFYANPDYSGITEGALACRSLSPTYNATAALKAQLEYAIRRIEIIEKLNGKSIENREAIINKINGIIEAAEESKAENCVELIEDTMSLITDDVLKSDMSLALKIARLSKDEYKTEYNQKHPLPESDTSEEVSECVSEASESEADYSEQEQTGDNKSSLPWVAISVGAAIIAVVAVIIIIIKRRK